LQDKNCVILNFGQNRTKQSIGDDDDDNDLATMPYLSERAITRTTIFVKVSLSNYDSLSDEGC
jgi:hypothetical protein